MKGDISSMKKEIKDATVLIFASGEAKRLGSICKKKPKCLLKFEGRPFLHYLLQWIFNSGIKKVVVTAHANSDKVVDFISENWPDKDIEVVVEKEIVSTAASVLAGLKHITTRYAFVMVGDAIWSGVDLRQMLNKHISQKANGTVLLTTELGSNAGMVRVKNPDLVVSMWPGLGDEKTYDILARTMGLYLVNVEGYKICLEGMQRLEGIANEREPFACLKKVVAYWLKSDELHLDFGTPEKLAFLRKNTQLIRKAFNL